MGQLRDYFGNHEIENPIGQGHYIFIFHNSADYIIIFAESRSGPSEINDANFRRMLLVKIREVN